MRIYRDYELKPMASEDQPTLSVRVLVWVPELERWEVGWYINKLDEWRILNSPSPWKVTHWANFPSPPKDRHEYTGD